MATNHDTVLDSDRKQAIAEDVKLIRPIPVGGMSCSHCGKRVEESEDGVFCSDCGALFCRECVEDGCFFDHYSEEDEY